MTLNPRDKDGRVHPPMSVTTRIYIGAVIAAGALVLGTFAPRELPQPVLALTFLAAMLVVSLFKLRLPLGRGDATLSMAYVVDFAVLLTAGADLAMLIAAAGVLVQCTVNVRRRQPWFRTAFSVAAIVLAIQAGGATWTLLGGGDVATGVAAVLPLITAAIVYFGANSGLVALAVALSSGQSPLRIWQQHFVHTAPSCIAAAAVVAALHAAVTGSTYVLLGMAAVPVAAGYVAYAAWFRHVAARQHTATPATV